MHITTGEAVERKRHQGAQLHGFPRHPKIDTTLSLDRGYMGGPPYRHCGKETGYFQFVLPQPCQKVV